jgi:uncharacterized protein (DUF983 family)
MSQKPGMLSVIAGNLCPKCFQGKVMQGLMKIHHQCPSCGFVIQKEEGYFIGAMIAAYFFSFFTAIPVFLIGYFLLESNLAVLTVICCVLIALLGPLFYRIAVLFWLWLETNLQSKLDAADEKRRR